MARLPEKPIYRVTFLSQGQVYEVYARRVSQAGMLGFVEVEELLWGERTQMLIDPSEERLRTEFAGVRRTFLPMHAVIRIDEVDKVGAARIATAQGGGATVAPFPVPVPGKSDPGKH